MKRPQLALYGNFGKHNIGNECTLRAVLVHLRKQVPEAGVLCVCSDPAVVRRDHGVESVAIFEGQSPGNPQSLGRRLVRKLLAAPRQLRELWRAHSLLKGVDAFILVGTGMLEDDNGGTAWPLAIYRWTFAARLRGCRVIALGIGAGPFQTRATRILSTAILRAADYVSYRDQPAKDCVNAAGLDTSRHVVVPDLAFSLPLQTSSRAVESLRVTAVALGVIDRSKFSSEPQYQAYLQTLSAFASLLIQEGHAVRVIHGDGLYDHESLAALRALIAGKGTSNEVERLSFPSIATLEDLLAVLGDVEVVVASRYHNMILALMLGKPVLALSYHWKFESVMSWFGLSRYVCPIREVELSWLVAGFKELLAAREQLNREIRTAAEACRESVMSQYRVVFQLAQARRAR